MNDIHANDIRERLARCFSNVFPAIRPDELPTASSTTLPAWDSLGQVRLLAAIEEEFGLQFEMQDFEDLVSYPLIVAYLVEKSFRMNDAAGLPALHHIGFVVASIELAMPGFLRSLNASWDEKVFEDPHQKVKVAFLSTRPGELQIELVEPVGEASPVRKFLQEKGGGLHHVCYQTADLETELKAFRSRGAMPVKRPLPAVAFGGRRIAWLLTRENLLVELLETNLPA